LKVLLIEIVLKNGLITVLLVYQREYIVIAIETPLM